MYEMCPLHIPLDAYDCMMAKINNCGYWKHSHREYIYIYISYLLVSTRYRGGVGGFANFASNTITITTELHKINARCWLETNTPNAMYCFDCSFIVTLYTELMLCNLNSEFSVLWFELKNTIMRNINMEWHTFGVVFIERQYTNGWHNECGGICQTNTRSRPDLFTVYYFFVATLGLSIR